MISRPQTLPQVSVESWDPLTEEWAAVRSSSALPSTWGKVPHRHGYGKEQGQSSPVCEHGKGGQLVNLLLGQNLRMYIGKESVLCLPGQFDWVFFYSLFLNNKSPSYSTTQIHLLKLISVMWTLILCFLTKLETIRTKRQYAMHRIHVKIVWTFKRIWNFNNCFQTYVVLICPNSNAPIGNFILLLNLKGCVTGTQVAIFYSVFPCLRVSIILSDSRRKKMCLLIKKYINHKS